MVSPDGFNKAAIKKLSRELAGHIPSLRLLEFMSVWSKGYELIFPALAIDILRQEDGTVGLMPHEQWTIDPPEPDFEGAMQNALVQVLW
jgi:hypothetical protein